MILVEFADGDHLLGASELSADHAVLRTVARFQSQTTLGPELPFGAEPVWRLNEREQQDCSNRTDRRDLAQQPRGVVFFAFGEQLLSHLLMPNPQAVKLLVVELGPAMYATVFDFCEPLGTMAR